MVGVADIQYKNRPPLTKMELEFYTNHLHLINFVSGKAQMRAIETGSMAVLHEASGGFFYNFENPETLREMLAKMDEERGTMFVGRGSFMLWKSRELWGLMREFAFRWVPVAQTGEVGVYYNIFAAKESPVWRAGFFDWRG